MKITPEHYAMLKDLIRPLVPFLPAYRKRIAAEYTARKGTADQAQVETRVIWDAFHGAEVLRRIPHLYNYLNDEHINTALRHAVAELEREQADKTTSNQEVK